MTPAPDDEPTAEAGDPSGLLGPPTEEPRRFTEDLEALLDRAAGRPLTIGQIQNVLRIRGMALVVSLLAAPFVLPIPLPLLSTPFGIAIAVMGLRLGFGLKPWLPRRIRRRRVAYDTLKRIVRASTWVLGPLERILKPRYPSPPAWRVLRATAGIGIAVAAAILCLPLPFPGANAVPALAIVLLAFGIMERDSIFVLAGHLVVVAAYAYLYLWWDLVVTVVSRLLPG